MLTKICAYINNTKITQFFPFFPTKICPHCLTTFNGHYLSAHLIASKSASQYTHLHVLHYCSVCSKPFLTIYASTSDGRDGCPLFEESHTYPAKTVDVSFSSYIQEISPRFPEIYRQALQAENAELHEICGAGYRKALEFLVKDYFSSKIPQDADHIKKERLSDTIKRFEDEKIKTVAAGCNYLANDEIHYLRKLSESDLELLKNLLLAVVAEIDKDGYYLRTCELR